MKAIFYTVLLALTVGCAHEMNNYVLADNPAIATKQIQGWIPNGTEATNAESIMRQRGFECSIKQGDFLDGSNLIKNVDYISFYKTQTAGWPVQQRYWGGLILTNGKVSDVKLLTGLVGP